jgi:hypothetical protein
MSDFLLYAPILLLEFAFAATVIFLIRYSKWKQGWLSGRIDKQIYSMQSRDVKRLARIAPLLRPKNIYYSCRSFLFGLTASAHDYTRNSVPIEIKQWYFPSVASFLLIALLIFATFAVSHPGDLTVAFLKKKFVAPLNELPEGTGITEIFAGLIAITVALIIFVAESIRESRSRDQKRVLLRISTLWQLAVAVTLFPLGLLWGHPTLLTAFITVGISLWAIFAFARVIRNLLDPDLQENARRQLLKERIRALIMKSVRERVGNNLLVKTLRFGGKIKIDYSVSRSWVEGGQSKYIFIDAPKSGWLSDINFVELLSLSQLLESESETLGFALRNVTVTATGASSPKYPNLKPGVLFAAGTICQPRNSSVDYFSTGVRSFKTGQCLHPKIPSRLPQNLGQ